MNNQPTKTMESKSSNETFDLGKTTGALVDKGIYIALKGELGAGKTTFVQGFAKGVGVSEKYYITSPTFNIINQYPGNNLTLCHLDLYRLSSVEELEYTGFDDLIEKNNVLIIEWPELLEQIDFKFDIEINFKFDADYNRILSFFASGQQGANLINKLALK
ncbi:MAG: tRNA (adenosine(37)-N6)-threonylcarbamoyltransferase complex ATPase subunit type 1 TsaE [Desulfobacula sp.]|nr:tRNA (adenosine(37)-N6)-threonylcarbamoyltransferase complex ATPase subunit type 1 TsaE [Desulfobacula sp.]